jgi:hypothetical protein
MISNANFPTPNPPLASCQSSSLPLIHSMRFVTAAVTHLFRVCYGSNLNFAPILPMCYGCYGSRGG